MPRNIVLCSDGTGNSAIKDRGTNVFKLYEALDLNGHRKNPGLPPQLAFYDDGVGTERFKPLRMLGGAFGWGLSRNVKELYASLVRAYEPGDRLFLFGFSRGAYTVRTLAGFIATCGVLRREAFACDADLWHAVGEAYEEYRRKYRTFTGRLVRKPYARERSAAFKQVHSVQHPRHAPGGDVRIEFIGVWDTVDAVGLPVDFLADLINAFIYRFRFPDQKLSPLVTRACHAISVDDERRTFHPVMWDEQDEKAGRIEQLWFAGVHANVGGGYDRQGMSLVALDWMMAQAERQRLRFLPAVRASYRQQQNVNDRIYDSRAGAAVYYRYAPRDIGAICLKHHLTPKLHISTLERIAAATDGYAPGNLPRDLQIVSPGTGAAQLARLGRFIRGIHGNSRTLLDRVRGPLRLRMWLHSVLLVFSLAALYLTVAPLVDEAGAGTVLGMLLSGEGWLDLAGAAGERPWLVGVLIAAWFGGRVLATRMRRVFSAFWCPHLARLRRLLA
jgi:uncharacterized protein (DUF2235 family)